MNTVVVSFSDLIDKNNIENIVSQWNIKNSLNPKSGLYNDAILSIKNRILITPIKDVNLSLKSNFTKEMGIANFFRCVKFMTRYGKW